MSMFTYYIENKNLLSEDIHPDIKTALNANISAYRPNTIGNVTKAIRKTEKAGQDTGFDKKSAGSSRVFFGHKDPHTIKLDGKDTSVNVGTKVAKRFDLDNHTGESRSLGNIQNENEIDSAKHHSIFRKKSDGSFETNHEGTVAPVIDHADDHDHLTMVKADKFSTKRFQESTKSTEFPKGLSFKKFHGALMREHDRSHGKYYRPDNYGHKSHEEIDETLEHPETSKFNNMILDTGLHPGDLSPRNMGHITHPHTGRYQNVIIDAGFNDNASKLYKKARIHKMEARRAARIGY